MEGGLSRKVLWTGNAYSNSTSGGSDGFVDTQKLPARKNRGYKGDNDQLSGDGLGGLGPAPGGFGSNPIDVDLKDN